MIKLKDLLRESSPGYKNRKFGDPLPTLKSVMEKHQRKSGKQETIKESSMPGFGTPTDVSYYYNTWGEIFSQLSRFNDYGPRENDMYDWDDRRHYDDVVKEYHAHMKKIAKKLNSAVRELEGSYKMWNRILEKHRKKDRS